MITYNEEVLTKLFSSLSTLTKTNVAIFNEDFEGTNARNLNVITLCTCIKKHLMEGCKETDRIAISKGRKAIEPFYYRCHFGFIEILLRIKVNQQNSFYVIIGPFKDVDNVKNLNTKISDFANNFNESETILKKAFKKMPSFTKQKFDAIINIIDAILSYSKATKLITVKEDIFEETIRPYILDHIDSKTIIKDLSKNNYISVKKLGEIIKAATGLTSKRYITKCKIEYAYDEIIYSDKSLQDICFDVGIEDYNYFIKVFKLYKGKTPFYYRKHTDEN